MRQIRLLICAPVSLSDSREKAPREGVTDEGSREAPTQPAAPLIRPRYAGPRSPVSERREEPQIKP